jgi:glyoxylase-like metal-dependent hydrolase (beta-lactamase superfamily II)
VSGGEDSPPVSETTSVAEGVYQFEYDGYNTLFVVTPEGVVAFDPLSVEATAEYAGEIARIAPGIPLLAVVYSHHHSDHAPGANVLRERLGPDAPIIAHSNATSRIRSLVDPDVPAPTMTFSDRATLHFGGVPIELHYLGPSHSDNLLVARLPSRGVAFAVDFVAADRAAFQDFPGTVFPDLFTSIERLGDMEFETIVFGHGPPGDMSTIDRQVAYYGALRAAVQEAVDAGWSEDEAAAQIQLPAFQDFGQYEEWFELNVRGLYRWMAGDP